MAKINPFLQSPFQALIDKQAEPIQLPGSDLVTDVEVPDLSEAPEQPAAQVAQPAAPAPKKAKAKPASLIPPADLMPVFSASASHFGVPENVLMAIAQQESSYDPEAVNAESGASGIVQYMDATAKSLGINRHDPNEAIPAAAMQIAERLAKGASLEDAVMEHFAGPDRKKWGDKTRAYGKSVLEKAEAIGRELYKDMPSEAPAEAAPAVTADATPLPNFGVAPEALKRIQAQWNAATPEERVQMESLRGPRGYIARELNKRHPAKQAAPNPLGLEIDPVAQVNEAYKNPTLDSIDPRAEARARNLVNQGMEGGTANKVARAAALAGMTPGTEPGIGQRIENSDFDFATRKKYQEDPFFSNPAVRGAVKGYEGYKRGILGLNQMAAEVLGANNLAGSLSEAGAESREAEGAMGEANSYGQRMFEGAVSSIAQQVPALIGGAVTGSEGLVLGTMFAQTFGSEYSEGRARGQNEEQAVGRAALYGTFEVVGEKLGLGDTLKGLRGAVDGATTRDVATNMARALLKEIPGEQLTTLGQFGADKLGGGYGLNTEAGLSEYLQQAADTAVQTVIQGGIMGGVTTGASAVGNRLAPQRAQPQAMPQERVEPSLQPEAQSMQPAAPSMQPEKDDESWSGEVMGDDGVMRRVDSQLGVVEPEAPSGPLEASIAAVAAEAPQAGPLSSAVAQAAQLHDADPAPLPAMPEPEPQAPDYTAMPVEELKAQVQQLAAQDKQATDPEQRKKLRAERKTVEKEIGARAKQAQLDSKPAEEPMSMGPFDDIKTANKMMMRYAEKTSAPHEVIEKDGKFTVQPLEASDGLDTAGASGRDDGRGRSGEPAAGVGLPDGAGRAGTGTVPVSGNDGTAGERGSDAASNRTAADEAADPDSAVAKNPYAAYSASKPEFAESYMDKRSVDRSKYEVQQTGPVRWQIVPRAAQDPIATTQMEEVADVSERQEVPEEAQAPSGAQSTEQAGAGDRAESVDAAAGTSAAQAAPELSDNGRRYHVVAINEKTGEKTVVSREDQPMTHAQAVAMKSKFSSHPARRIQLEEVRQPAKSDAQPKRKVNESVARRQAANAKQEEAVAKAEASLAARAAKKAAESAEPQQAAAEQPPAPIQQDSKPKRKPAAKKKAEPVEEAEGVRYSVAGDDRAPSAELRTSVLIQWGKIAEPVDGYEFLVARNKKNNRGIFIIDGKFDRDAFKKVIGEAASAGLDTKKLYIVAETAPYTSTSIDLQKFSDFAEGSITGRKNVEKEVRYSVSEDGDTDYSLLDLPMLADSLPVLDSFVEALASAGIIKLHANASTLPVKGKVPQGVQALTTADGKIHVVANALSNNAKGIVLHEAFHAGVKGLVGTKVWSDLMQRLGAMYKQGQSTNGAANEFWKAARQRVKVAQLKGAVAEGMEAEEFGAYAIEEYANAPLTVKKWVDDLLGAIKAWVLRRFGAQLGKVTPAQLSALAKVALLDVRASRMEPAFSTDDRRAQDRRAQDRGTPERRHTIQVEGKRRPIENSKGQLLAEDMNKQLNFYKWFKDSKVVDEQGRPLVVYHGTQQSFDEFKTGRNRAKDEEGIFFSPDPAVASAYSGYDENFPSDVIGSVMPSYLRIERLKVVDFEGGKHGRAEAIRSAIDGGYDGLLMKNHYDAGGVQDQYVVFSPEQIKSATGNAGTFDAENPDIRYSVSGSLPAGAAAPAQAETEQNRSLKPAEQGLLRRVQAQIQDSFNRVKQVQERITELTGIKDLGGADVYRAETNRPGRIAARKEDARDKLIEPMMQRLAKAGYTPAQLSELLHAQHAEERNAAVASINPEFPDGGSGLTNKQAQEILKRYENEGDLLRLADEARNIARSTLDLKLAYGLITQVQYDTLAISYDNYVPLKGDGEYGPKVKRAMGHEERDEHILENIARDYEQAIVVGEKNLARQSLLQLVLHHPDDSLWSARVPPKGRYVAGTVFNISRKGSTDIEASFTSQSQVAAWLEAMGAAASQYEVNTSGGEQVVEFTKPLQDNEVMVYVKGDPVRIQLKDEKLARQLRPLKSEQMNAVLEAMRKHNRYLSMIFTGYNPAFIIKNASRDAITGTINMTGNHGAATAAKAWAKYPMAWATMLKWAATKNVPDNEMGRMLTEYRAQGGKVGASYMSDLEEQGKSLQRMYDDAKGVKGYAAEGKVGKAAWIAARKAVGGAAHVVEIINQAFENALRLALFAQLRAEGKKPGVAAAAAKSVTVNFDRKGAMTAQMGAFYLFINPAIQGTANATITLTKGEHKYQAWALTGMMAAAGFGMAAMGMDDDKDRWLGEKWDTRTKNLRLRVGETTINIPMSQEFAPFYAIGVAMGEVSRGESSMKAAANVMTSFLDAYYPMQGAVQPDNDDPGKDAVVAHTPTVLKALVQIWMNHNSFGSKVVPETENTKNRPDNLKMSRSTKGSVYDKAAQALATGKPYENDLSKVSPETIKLLWSTYTGGLGRFVADTVGAGNLARQADVEMDVSDVPIVKDFVKPDSINPIRSRFYDLSDEARKTVDEFNAAKKALDGDAMREITSDPVKKAHIGLAKMVKSINEVQTIYAEQAVAINADKKLNDADKRARLKQLEAEQEAIYRKAIEAFKQ